MLRIGEFSKLGKVTIKALRYYDEVGLLKPHFVSSENNYRYYEFKQLETLCSITSYKSLGFSLDEINYLISDDISAEEVGAMLLKKQSKIQNNIDMDSDRLLKLNYLIKRIQEGKNMEKIILKQLPEVIVASKRTKIFKYEDLHEIAPEMGRKMQEHGAVCKEPAYCFNIYHDDEYKEQDIDVEVCESIVDFCKNKDGIIYKKIGAIDQAACIVHQGPYETLGESYSQIYKWIEENGYVAYGNARESFIDGCWNKDNPMEWLTEIQIPVKTK